MQSPHRLAFSLVETIIATGIIALVLLFSITLGSVSLRNSVLRAQTVQALSLATSQIEQVRSIRDNAWLNNYNCNGGQVWNCWVGSNHSSTPTTGAYYQVINSNSPYLERSSDPITKTLIFGDGTINYSAQIRIKPIYAGTMLKLDSNHEVNELNQTYLVESKVTWDSFQKNNTVTLQTLITDWLPRF